MSEPSGPRPPATPGSEILDGLWRFEALHPEWTEPDGEEDGWDQQVAWWAAASPDGLVLIDPLVFDWDALDQSVSAHQGCAGIIRTCHWHQRSVAEAADRYGAEVWAKPAPAGSPRHPFDRAAGSGQEMAGGLVGYELDRADEIAVWAPAQRALIFGDAMLRGPDGELRTCPESWTQPRGGPERLRELLRGLTALPVANVLVSHGPNVLGDGALALPAALS